MRKLSLVKSLLFGQGLICIIAIITMAILGCSSGEEPPSQGTIIRVGMPLTEARTILNNAGARQDEGLARQVMVKHTEQAFTYELPDGSCLMLFASQSSSDKFEVSKILFDDRSHLVPPRNKQDISDNIKDVNQIDLAKYQSK